MSKKFEVIGANDEKISVEVSDVVAKIIAEGMTSAAKADKNWKDNFDKIIRDFMDVSEFDARSVKAADIREALRDSEGSDQMYQVFQQSHPEYKRANTAKLASEAKQAAGDAEDADNQKLIYTGLISRIRTVAMAQVRTCIRYFADEYGADGKSESRDSNVTAESLMRDAIREWKDRISKERGNFKLPAERVILQRGCDALDMVLAKASQGLALEMPTSTLVAQPRTQGADGKKSGEVTILTGEAATAAVQK